MDFADGNKNRVTRKRTIIVYKIQNSTQAIYSAIPLDFFSYFRAELELLLVPERTFTPSDTEARIVRNSRSIHLGNLKQTIEAKYISELTTLTGKSQDLIDLGDDPVTFIFVGDIENPSFSKTISFIVTGKKLRKNVEKSKVQTKNILLVSLDQVLGNLEVLNGLDDLEMSEEFADFFSGT